MPYPSCKRNKNVPFNQQHPNQNETSLQDPPPLPPLIVRASLSKNSTSASMIPSSCENEFASFTSATKKTSTASSNHQQQQQPASIAHPCCGCPPKVKGPTVDFCSTASIVKFISPSSNGIYSNDTEMNKMIMLISANTLRYDSKADSLTNKLFNILGNHHASLGNLGKKVIDPLSGIEEYQLIILTQGEKAKAKYDVPNAALLIVVINLKMVGYEDVDMTSR
jgi:hypothetical protein